ncbi:hypothetical protein [Streptomyces sp. WAC06614]|uniref:hypothetical protein n=1 Tax=Streptomyces sp. WAC06614 TaxID=2487416 RepID=UPI000F7B49A8|nr:hypothetical protein [Streptomyces sp. WAC06614]RSS79492.1 hypothetical protein EF918_17170 [Streptomyces sp. WAC06614]
MRPVTVYSLALRTGESRIIRWRPEAITTFTARQCIRRGRRNDATVSVYETCDRNGVALHVAHVHYGPGHYSGADFVTDIYEIPTAALTDL